MDPELFVSAFYWNNAQSTRFWMPYGSEHQEMMDQSEIPMMMYEISRYANDIEPTAKQRKAINKLI